MLRLLFGSLLGLALGGCHWLLHFAGRSADSRLPEAAGPADLAAKAERIAVDAGREVSRLDKLQVVDRKFVALDGMVKPVDKTPILVDAGCKCANLGSSSCTLTCGAYTVTCSASKCVCGTTAKSYPSTVYNCSVLTNVCQVAFADGLCY